jgi:cbb3-type cytochrome oxidase subunit 3
MEWLVLLFPLFFHIILVYIYFSSEDEDEEEEEELELDDSEESDVAGRNRRGGSGRYRRKAEPVRRSTRARITRFDKEFSKLLLIITE